MGFPMRLHVTEHPPVALPEPVIAEMCHGARKVRAVRFLRGISSPSARKSLSQKAWMMVPKFRELEPAGRLASPNRSPPARGIVRMPASQHLSSPDGNTLV